MPYKPSAMLTLVRRAHGSQSRSGGRIPYWHHCAGVAELLAWAFERSGEIPEPVAYEDFHLAALGHDLYEDTEVTRAEIIDAFGPRVDELIEALTNRQGDDHQAAYHRQIATGPEEARLIKLCDLIDNTLSVAEALPELGQDWVKNTFLPIVSGMQTVVLAATYPTFPVTGRVLGELLAYVSTRLDHALQRDDA
ncbi:bifunctional (p)ppGpp synthetase/guanosine-3',5'-bis(diphosphate) 3'-pyrophosphohydrolase [Candidatus Berkelbacteria bacterium]|nr:bifunctional (p)ppGpp synthetase/guanosine-3',5'-bis(diphosphate) 3'-pyrophosphohydrolase [Candidatus Berkelbacteria bacterium]